VGLDAVEVGKVTADNKLRVLQHGEVVAEIPNQALTDDAPVSNVLARWEPPVPREMPEHIKLNEPGLGHPDDFTQNLKHCSPARHLRQARVGSNTITWYKPTRWNRRARATRA